MFLRSFISSALLALLAFLIIFIIGAIPALIFLFLLRKRYLGLTKVFLLILIALSAAASVHLTYGLGAGFFGGAFSCLTIPIAASSLIVLILAGARFLRPSKEDRSRRRLYLMGVLLIPFLLFAPLLGELLIMGTCDALNRQTGNTIVQALDAYKQDHESYPEDLDALVPSYISALPSARCFTPYQWFHGSDYIDLATKAEFSLHKCPRQGVTLLVIPSVEFDFFQRYNLTTGNWSRVSFLDGKCSHLR
jgi:hypothetical protein